MKIAVQQKSNKAKTTQKVELKNWKHCKNGSVVNLIKRRLCFVICRFLLFLLLLRFLVLSGLVALAVLWLVMHFPMIRGCGKTVINGFLRLLNVDKSLIDEIVCTRMCQCWKLITVKYVCHVCYYECVQQFDYLFITSANTLLQYNFFRFSKQF